MTGFARQSGEGGGYHWTWEARSVNGRGLDCRCRLPAGYEALEPAARKAVAERFQRGNLALNLQLVVAPGEARLQINWSALAKVVEAARILETEHGAAPPRADGLLALRGVLEGGEAAESDDERTRREAELLRTLEQALDGLARARLAEGGHLARIMTDHLDRIETLAGEAANCAATRPEAIRERLRQQVAALLDAGAPMPEERLIQELAVLAAKVDVREELDRIGAHVAAARALLTEGGAIGRRLDFLAQEFNREANTLCSKSQDVELTRIGIELKTVIDQLREQAQNIE
jgi:uncharacterized protein (TIGR00255 family)